MNTLNKTLLITTAILVTFGTLHSVNAQPPKPDSLAREIAAAKRAGLPVSLQDLQAQMPLPDQNASLIYTRMKRLQKAKPISPQDENDVFGFGTQRFPDAQHVAAARSVLVRRSDVLALIHQAAVRPRCFLVYDRTNLSALPIDELAMMRESAGWLSSESYLMLLEGKPLEAVRNQALGFRIAHQAANDPDFIVYSVANFVDMVTSAGMERILYTRGDNPRVAEAVEQVLAKERRPLSFDHMLGGELVQGLIELQKIRQSDMKSLDRPIDGHPTQTYRKKYSYPTDNRQARSRYIRRHATYILTQIPKIAAALKRPYPEAVARLRSLTPNAADQQRDDDSFSTILMPAFATMLVQGAHAQAKITETRAAAALLVWKAKHGAFPTTLSQAISPVPTDPFDGRPLRYRREGAGFVVYSIGETGRFDGGKPKVVPPRSETLFRYPRPAYWK